VSSVRNKLKFKINLTTSVALFKYVTVKLFTSQLQKKRRVSIKGLKTCSGSYGTVIAKELTSFSEINDNYYYYYYY
jgi:hypothetical protein